MLSLQRSVRPRDVRALKVKKQFFSPFYAKNPNSSFLNCKPVTSSVHSKSKIRRRTLLVLCNFLIRRTPRAPGVPGEGMHFSQSKDARLLNFGCWPKNENFALKIVCFVLLFLKRYDTTQKPLMRYIWHKWPFFRSSPKKHPKNFLPRVVLTLIVRLRSVHGANFFYFIAETMEIVAQRESMSTA